MPLKSLISQVHRNAFADRDQPGNSQQPQPAPSRRSGQNFHRHQDHGGRPAASPSFRATCRTRCFAGQARVVMCGRAVMREGYLLKVGDAVVLHCPGACEGCVKQVQAEVVKSCLASLADFRQLWRCRGPGWLQGRLLGCLLISAAALMKRLAAGDSSASTARNALTTVLIQGARVIAVSRRPGLSVQ